MPALAGLSSFGFGSVASLESFHTASPIEHPALAGEKGMTLAANLNPQHLPG